ncbi:MAG: hypothetical protein K6C36_02155 [Clostridia bacterium]|nr:hypothetical protein [Clostridia bacterium]
MFVKCPQNPIYGGPATGTLFDAYVSRLEDGRLRMDLSWRPENALAVAFSDDGVSWTPPRITLCADPSTGWEDGVNRNCVVRAGDKYMMWYTGQARGYSFIGLAESRDGLTFSRTLSEPVLFPERPWEGASVMNPCVLYESGVYRMWYSAGETYEPNVLAYAESRDGVSWRKSPINPFFVSEPKNEFERERIGGCQVIPHKKLGYLLFYIGYKDIDTACVCCACSPDGVTRFRRYRYNPVAAPTPGEWDGDSCYKPTALYDGRKDEWLVWYNGRSGGSEYIGLTTKKGDLSPDDFI